MAISFPESGRGGARARRRLALGLAAAVLIGLLSAASGTIPAGPGQPPINWSARTFDFDYKTRLMHLHGDVQISQGDLSIAADEAQATSQDSRQSHWVFTGNVHVRAESQGDLRADRAIVEITHGELASALVSGSPAQFEQTRATAGALVKGHAATIDYDVAAGTVRLTGDAWLSDDRNDNEMHSPSITYNVRERRIQGQGGTASGGPVHLVITPKTNPARAAGAAPGADHSHDHDIAPEKP